MENFWFLFIVAIVAVGLLVLGLSITILIKGRNMQGDISENDAMRARGIECAAATMRREEAALHGQNPMENEGCGKGVCADCAVKDDESKNCD